MCMICWGISCNTKLRSHKDAALAAWLLGRYISLEMIWQCAVCLYVCVCVCFCVVLFWYFFACVFMFVHLCYSVFVSLCLRFRVCVSVCLCFVWKHTGRKRREKTQTENTEREHREETQRENTHRKHRQHKRFCGGVFVVYGWVFELKASKMIVSCEASYNFHRTSFQNERFARGFLKISQKKLPKWSFRARLPPNFREKASKRIVSCEASSKFHRTILPKRAFRAMLPTISAENLRFATVSRDRHTDSCERVHPPNHKCASHYSAAHSQMWQCAFRYSAVHKNVWIYRPWTVHKNVRFYYSFGRSTPRF